MTAHSSLRRKLRKNRKGYSAIIATIIMVLVILYFYFNVATFSMKRDQDLQDAVSRATQLDADRAAEKVAITDVAISPGPMAGQLTVTCTLANMGTVPIQMARLWLKDQRLLQNNVGNIALLDQSVLLQPGSRIQLTSPTITVPGSVPSDSFYLWFVTFRGNSFSQTAN